MGKVLGMQRDEDFRISIAGAQEKTALTYWQEQWYKPIGTTPTTHIFKLPLPYLESSVENEWFCLRFLNHLGINVPEVAIKTFVDQKVLILTRFDRKLIDNGIIRLPQEDMCQALGILSGKKYQSDGGPSIKDVMGVLKTSSNSLADQHTFMKTQVVYWLLAAIDGHAKNFSIFLQPRGLFSLTPIYDVISVYPYFGQENIPSKQKIKMAMAVYGEKKLHYKWNEILRRHWLTTAQKIGFAVIVNKFKQSILIPSIDLTLTNFELCLIYKFEAAKEFESFDFWLDYNGYILETTDTETFTFQEQSRKIFDSPKQMLEEVVSICEEKIKNGFKVIVGEDRTEFEKERDILQKQWEKAEKQVAKQLKGNKKLLKTYLKDNNPLKTLFKEIQWDNLKAIHLEDSSLKLSEDVIIQSKMVWWINGDLTIDGNIRPRLGNCHNTILVILGNLTVAHLWLDGAKIYVAGDLICHEYIWKPPYSGFEVVGQIQTKGYVANSPKDGIFKDISYVPIDSSFIKAPIINNGYLKSRELIKALKNKENLFLLSDEEIRRKGIELLAQERKATEEYMLPVNVFKRQLDDWGYLFCYFAGAPVLDISEDDEIVGNAIYPGGGDWVVYDERGQAGTYGISHDDQSIYQITIKKTKKHGVDYTLKPLKLILSTEELMKRFQWISWFFSDWTHDDTPSPLDYWEEVVLIDEDYQKEKQFLTDDPHLALYWLIHFGLLMDKRYQEVKELFGESQHELILGGLAFFEALEKNSNFVIKGGYNSDKETLKTLFQRRRAYAIYITQSQSYRGGKDHLDNWWKSVTLYPKAEKNMILRMRWLRNNLLKFDKWDDFDKLLKPEEVSLLSYVLACNPNTKDKAKNANAFLQELIDNKLLWKNSPQINFAQIMIWDVREWVTQKDLLRQAIDFYFANDTTSKEYEDLMQILDKKIENIAEVRTTVANLHKAFAGYDRFKTSLEDKKVYFAKIETLLSEKQPKVLFQVVENINNQELSKRCFHYLFTHDIPNKKQALIKLFVKIGLSDHDINKVFFEEFPNLIKDENDPNLEIVKAFFTIPEENFRNGSAGRSSRGATAMFFLNIAHLPSVFAYLMDLILDSKTNEIPALKEIIFSHILSKEYDSKINPTHLFSKEQIETMLQTCVDFVTQNISNQKTYHLQALNEAIRSIYYCDNSLAKDWITQRHNNKKWLKQFSDLTIDYENLKIEINDALKSALEFIKNAPYKEK